MNIGRLELTIRHPALHWWGGEIAWRHKHDWGYHWVLSWGVRDWARAGSVESDLIRREAEHESELQEQLEQDRADRLFERE